MSSPAEELPETRIPTPCTFGDMVTYEKEGALTPGKTFTQEQIDAYRQHTTACAYCAFVRGFSPESVFKRR